VSVFGKLAFSVFLAFFANFPANKKLSRKLSACIVHVLDATFVSNLTFLAILSREISFGEKTVTQLGNKLNSHCLYHVSTQKSHKNAKADNIDSDTNHNTQDYNAEITPNTFKTITANLSTTGSYTLAPSVHKA